jgi:hypothetical protein
MSIDVAETPISGARRIYVLNTTSQVSNHAIYYERPMYTSVLILRKQILEKNIHYNIIII